MMDLFKRPRHIPVSTVAQDHITLIKCIDRINDLLDEEVQLLEQGRLDELERVNIRKAHILSEFSRHTQHHSLVESKEIQTYLDSCRLKAQRNFEALATYLRAVEDLNQMILDHLRKEESDGTYSRSVATRF